MQIRRPGSGAHGRVGSTGGVGPQAQHTGQSRPAARATIADSHDQEPGLVVGPEQRQRQASAALDVGGAVLGDQPVRKRLGMRGKRIAGIGGATVQLTDDGIGGVIGR